MILFLFSQGPSTSVYKNYLNRIRRTVELICFNSFFADREICTPSTCKLKGESQGRISLLTRWMFVRLFFFSTGANYPELFLFPKVSIDKISFFVSAYLKCKNELLFRDSICFLGRNVEMEEIPSSFFSFLPIFLPGFREAAPASPASRFAAGFGERFFLSFCYVQLFVFVRVFSTILLLQEGFFFVRIDVIGDGNG